MGDRQLGEYAPSAFQYFLGQLNDYILELPQSSHLISKDSKRRYKVGFWGIITMHYINNSKCLR